jgi:hypothetical protein
MDLPDSGSLFNPLIDVEDSQVERNQITEFSKMCNEYYAPMFGVKYLLNINLYPFQGSLLLALLKHKFPMLLLSRGGGKTFMLAIFALYYAAMYPDSRIVLVSGTFRQAKHIFQEMDRIFKRAPLLQLIADKRPVMQNDRCICVINGSSIVGLPLGVGGGKIRGERGHVILVDEFDTIAKEVFDVVIRGFGATQQDPFEKTMEILRRLKRSRTTKEDVKDQIDTIIPMANAGNKMVVSGTAGHNAGPFCRLYKQYMKIIKYKMKGNVNQYLDLLEDGDEEDFDKDVDVDYRQYCVIKYPYTDLPPGIMEKSMIHGAKAVMSKAYFDMEYNCEFMDDSLGFFKYKDVQNATQKMGGWSAIARGESNKQYVIGVDPARTIDRFAVVIVEIGSPHRVVYAWSSLRWKYAKSVQYVRHLRRVFNTAGVALDATGGTGLAVQDLLAENSLMQSGDKVIVPFDMPDEEVPPNAEKILYPIKWNSVWIEEANVVLQKAVEDGQLQFPVETLSDGLKEDAKSKKDFELRDDATDEIVQAKREMMAIEVSYTTTGAKKFNLKPPDFNVGPGETVTHKDRYSALLMANYVACKIGTFEKFDPLAAARKAYTSADFEVGGWIEEFGGSRDD